MNKNTFEVRVRYADTDAADVIYYGAYARWLEMGREEILRDNGISYKKYAKKGIHAPVVRLEIDYKASATYDEIIVIETSIEKIGNSSITFKYVVKKKSDDTILIQANTVNVFIGKEREKISVPEEVRKILE